MSFSGVWRTTGPDVLKELEELVRQLLAEKV